MVLNCEILARIEIQLKEKRRAYVFLKMAGLAANVQILVRPPCDACDACAYF